MITEKDFAVLSDKCTFKQNKSCTMLLQLKKKEMTFGGFCLHDQCPFAQWNNNIEQHCKVLVDPTEVKYKEDDSQVKLEELDLIKELMLVEGKILACEKALEDSINTVKMVIGFLSLKNNKVLPNTIPYMRV